MNSDGVVNDSTKTLSLSHQINLKQITINMIYSDEKTQVMALDRQSKVAG